MGPSEVEDKTAGGEVPLLKSWSLVLRLPDEVPPPGSCHFIAFNSRLKISITSSGASCISKKTLIKQDVGKEVLSFELIVLIVER